MPGGKDWFSDTTISLPNPPPYEPLIDLGGFWFSAGGICLSITAAAQEDLSQPFQGTPQPVQGG
jgi:hypothetical protein